MKNDNESRQAHDIQQMKMAWLAAHDSGDVQAQLALVQQLRLRPNEQTALLDFIAAYHASDNSREEPLLPITQRASAIALERVLGVPVAQAQAQAATVQARNLTELRKARNLTKQVAARGLRLSVDVWEQFERGAIDLVSLSQRQLQRLADFFEVGVDQFGQLLDNSSPSFVLNRRQTREGVRQEQEAPQKQGKQDFKRAITRSNMTDEDKQFWLS